MVKFYELQSNFLPRENIFLKVFFVQQWLNILYQNTVMLLDTKDYTGLEAVLLKSAFMSDKGRFPSPLDRRCFWNPDARFCLGIVLLDIKLCSCHFQAWPCEKSDLIKLSACSEWRLLDDWNWRRTSEFNNKDVSKAPSRMVSQIWTSRFLRSSLTSKFIN